MSKGNILIVDDNKNVLIALEMLLVSEYNKVQCISSPNHLISELQGNNYNLVLLDMNFRKGEMEGHEGIFWLEKIRSEFKHVVIVLMTAFGDVDLAVKGIKKGAFDFIKPCEHFFQQSSHAAYCRQWNRA